TPAKIIDNCRAVTTCSTASAVIRLIQVVQRRGRPPLDLSGCVQGVLELPLGHLRAARNVPCLRPPIELLPCFRPIVASPRPRRLASACRQAGGILAARGAAAFALAARTDVRLAFAPLLAGLAARFLAFVFPEIASVLALALVFRRAGFPERDGDRLAAAPDLAAAPPSSALELAVLELVHHAARGPALSGR